MTHALLSRYRNSPVWTVTTYGDAVELIDEADRRHIHNPHRDYKVVHRNDLRFYRHRFNTLTEPRRGLA